MHTHTYAHTHVRTHAPSRYYIHVPSKRDWFVCVTGALPLWAHEHSRMRKQTCTRTHLVFTTCTYAAQATRWYSWHVRRLFVCVTWRVHYINKLYINIYIYICMYMFIYIYIHKYINTYMYEYMYMYVYMYTYIHTYIYTHSYIYIYVYKYRYIYMYM